jgi:hypothetical protein
MENDKMDFEKAAKILNMDSVDLMQEFYTFFVAVMWKPRDNVPTGERLERFKQGWLLERIKDIQKD